ncbi:hypothetical protein N0B44_21210 [Roseibacterium beibuensis]|uniref:DUF4231 domain-containing protein n=1 Tax=[Roseibacterium] beibuensis TaxID=1193142 RepID=UPI00217D8E28|nr:DUF4231 domain-containing protein [Roseibacterium beibuensis]MCS6625435.1 hypothetical protein [Roseibacterium beibuensis]
MTGSVAGDRPTRWNARPPSILGVGVTGHRLERLGSCDLGALQQTVSEVLARITLAANQVEPTRMRLVTALAEGADNIVADEALKRGWTVDAVLPFARDDYAEDFGEGPARDTHLDRLARAGAVLELPGDRTAEGGAPVAYERAGRLLLAQTDLLLAIWDGGPARGRGGAAQIVAEAILKGVPIICIDPAGALAPQVLWGGFEDGDLGQLTVDTVPRGDLNRLDEMLRDLLEPPSAPIEAEMLARFGQPDPRWRAWAMAYPLLLAVLGVRWPQASDIGLTAASGPHRPAIASCTNAGDFVNRLDDIIGPRFVHADARATRVAQLFRSGYVANFALAALAVVLALMGLVLPASGKPVLIVLELAAIATILLVTHAGNHSHWHRRWLDNRNLAERLRCLALSAQLGDLDLRGADEQTSPWVAWYARAAARELGLPNVRAGGDYLKCVRRELLALVDDQIAYMATEERRMHDLEHRLHLVGTTLFAMTALACLGFLGFKAALQMSPGLYPLQTLIFLSVTIICAAFPAIGAAVYGIRMQGDFGGAARRSARLRHQLSTLRPVIQADALDFDTLTHRVRRVADLLQGDLTSWLRTYHARPLALPV